MRAQTIRARVTEVVDGDTIRVHPLEPTRRSRYTVPLIGIDTPELYGGVECRGRQASRDLKRRTTGRRALLRTDPTQDTFDRYDRLMAYVRLRGGPDAAISQLGPAGRRSTSTAKHSAACARFGEPSAQPGGRTGYGAAAAGGSGRRASTTRPFVRPSA